MMHQTVGPRHLSTGIAYAVLASALWGQERFVESEEMYVQSIAILRERGALLGRIANRQSEYATVLTNLESTRKPSENCCQLSKFLGSIIRTETTARGEPSLLW